MQSFRGSWSTTHSFAIKEGTVGLRCNNFEGFSNMIKGFRNQIGINVVKGIVRAILDFRYLSQSILPEVPIVLGRPQVLHLRDTLDFIINGYLTRALNLTLVPSILLAYVINLIVSRGTVSRVTLMSLLRSQLTITTTIIEELLWFTSHQVNSIKIVPVFILLVVQVETHPVLRAHSHSTFLITVARWLGWILVFYRGDELGALNLVTSFWYSSFMTGTSICLVVFTDLLLVLRGLGWWILRFRALCQNVTWIESLTRDYVGVLWGLMVVMAGNLVFSLLIRYEARKANFGRRQGVGPALHLAVVVAWGGSFRGCIMVLHLGKGFFSCVWILFLVFKVVRLNQILPFLWMWASSRPRSRLHLLLVCFIRLIA